MLRRPAVIRVRKRCVKRKTARNVLLLVVVLMLLLCCGVEFLTSMILSGITVIVLNVYINRA